MREINLALDVVAPFTTVSPKVKYAPHLQASTKIMMKERDFAKFRYLNERSEENGKIYKS